MISLERLNTTQKSKYPTNTLIDYYDILHKLFEALSISEGIKFSGEGAHKELIDYISNKYNFSVQIKVFLQTLRDYRNRVSYEGLHVPENYILENETKINSLIKVILTLNKQ
ncbi:MAG: hypothetical protein AB7V77_04985 [Candidatus Woesearchaeota archaeon]